jgi:hypothetical protein
MQKGGGKIGNMENRQHLANAFFHSLVSHVSFVNFWQ